MVMSENEEEAAFFARLEERGEAAVTADLETARFGTRATLARKWLLLKEEERVIARDIQAVRSIVAAERAATASECAATASEKSAAGTLSAARWAM